MTKIAFMKQKKFTLLALALGLSIFYLGFQVIGSEWFAMWQSEKWNGIQQAFRNSSFFLMSLIFISTKND